MLKSIRSASLVTRKKILIKQGRGKPVKEEWVLVQRNNSPDFSESNLYQSQVEKPQKSGLINEGEKLRTLLIEKKESEYKQICKLYNTRLLDERSIGELRQLLVLVFGQNEGTMYFNTFIREKHVSKILTPRQQTTRTQ